MKISNNMGYGLVDYRIQLEIYFHNEIESMK